MEEDTLVADIVSQAFREGNFTAVGEETTPEELAEGVARLRNLVNAVFGFELGELLRDWYVPQELNPEAPLGRLRDASGAGVTTSVPYAYPPSNVRLLVGLSTPRTLYFPANPSDGARMAFLNMGTPDTVDVTLSGNGRFIEGETSITSDADATPDPVAFHGRKWLYRADRGEWVRLTQIAADGSVPTPPEFDSLWICGLAIALAARFQANIQPQIVQTYRDMTSRLKMRYKQTEAYPDSFESRQHFREHGL